MKLVVGLGNPGKQYESTRHNIGFMVLDSYLKNEKWGNKFNAMYVEKNINGEKVLFVKPLTFMNNSGNAVGEFVRYFNILASDILVIQDDLDLSVGNYKLKVHSSSGGHNGIKNIIAMTGTQNFMRIKVGVGEKPAGWDLADHVLGRFDKEDRAKVDDAIKDAVDAAVLMMQGDVDKAMNEFNSKKQE